MKKFLAVCFVAGLTLIAIDPTAAANEALRKALTFHASFDQVVDADFGRQTALHGNFLQEARRRQIRAASSRRSTGAWSWTLWWGS